MEKTEKFEIIEDLGEKPGVLSWFFALLMFVLAIGSFWTLDHLLTGYHCAKLQNALISVLESPSPAKLALNSPRFEEVLPKNNLKIIKAIEVLDLIQSSNFAKAHSQIARGGYPVVQASPRVEQALESLVKISSKRQDYQEKLNLFSDQPSLSDPKENSEEAPAADIAQLKQVNQQLKLAIKQLNSKEQASMQQAEASAKQVLIQSSFPDLSSRTIDWYSRFQKFAFTKGYRLPELQTRQS